MIERVQELLEDLRARLRMDGCDVELAEVTAEGVVKLRFTGSHACCPMAKVALLAGIESVLRADLPELRGVEAV